MSVIISKNGKKIEKIDESQFIGEDELQKYIYENPEIIPIDEVKEDAKLLVLSREFYTTSGPIDAIAIDRDGELYIIETKLYKNTDKRFVLSQVLDYGAALWNDYRDYRDFIQQLDKKVNEKFNISLNQKIMDFFGIEEEQVDEILENMGKNLMDGSFKFVILMNKISDRLKNLIKFVNQNSNFDVYGVELDYYKFQEYELIIPRLFGAELRKTLSTSSSKRRWNEESFFAELEKNRGEEEAKIARKIFEWAKEKMSYIEWGAGKIDGSCIPVVRIGDMEYWPFSLWTYGKIEIDFQYIKNRPPFDNVEIRKMFLEKLNSIPSVDIPTDGIERRPTIPLSVFKDEKNLEQLLSIFEWVIEQAKNSNLKSPGARI